jgi:hypothetical protein
MAIVALVLVAILLLGGGAIGQVALEESGTHYDFNESFNTSTAGDVVAFKESNLNDVYYDDTVNVNDENGTDMIAQQDYEWDSENGTLEVLAGELENDTNATIGYGYRQPTQTQQEFSGHVATIYQSGIWIPLLLFLALLLAALGVFGGLA